MGHPVENELALLAGGEAGRGRRFLLERHVRRCEQCQTKVAEYQALRADLLDVELPDVNWHFLASEMSANIRLGLEAGACVRDTQVRGRRSFHWTPAWSPRLAAALAVLVLLAGADVARNVKPLLHDMHWNRPGVMTAVRDSDAAVLESTISGVELRRGQNSLKLLDRGGNAANQTVSAQGDIGARYIDSETGAVTITNVYLQ